MTTVRGIVSRLDIVWSSDGVELQRVETVNASDTTNTSTMYSDLYTISQVNTNDDGRNYHCTGIINAMVQVSAVGNITLNAYGKKIILYYNVPHWLFSALVPKASLVLSQSVREFVSGLIQTLTCAATLVQGVSPSLVTINWNGVSVQHASPRVVVSDQINNGSQYIKSITFSPLLNSDGGQYSCSLNVTGFSEADVINYVAVLVNGMCSLIIAFYKLLICQLLL